MPPQNAVRSHLFECEDSERVEDAFPIQSRLSLAPVQRFWNSSEFRDNPFLNALATRINEHFEKYPELAASEVDPSSLHGHEEFIQALLSQSLPPASCETECVNVIIGCSDVSIYMTRGFKNRFGLIQSTPGALTPENLEQKLHFQLALCYRSAFQTFYGLKLPNAPIMPVAVLLDKTTGLKKYYEFQADVTFAEVVRCGAPSALSIETRNRILHPASTLAEWMEILPPDQFAISGLTFVKAVDITDTQNMAQVKRVLLESDGMSGLESFRAFENSLRNLFECPSLEVGFTRPRGQDLARFTCRLIEGSSYFEACERAITLSDEEKRAYLETGYRRKASFVMKGNSRKIVGPLAYELESLSFFDIQFPEDVLPNELAISWIEELLPLVATAIKRIDDTANIRLQAIIRETCTAIHPAVEWRFQQMARKYVAIEAETGIGRAEDVLFSNVYPLFASSDIRGSSTQRNHAIRVDLQTQIDHGLRVLDLAFARTAQPGLAELRYRLASHRTRLNGELQAGDELSLGAFLENEVNPVFDHLLSRGGEIASSVQEYKSDLDPHRGGIYRARRDLDESILALNTSLSGLLDQRQTEAQGFFPHYFEKHVTDGIDHSIYVGAALVPNIGFNKIYLRSLRLWQLEAVWACALECQNLQKHLKIPLSLAHLVMVQDSPMTIRFDYDEKHFGADGAYNIRYEIMKKRIDKASIKGRNERMTQPETIAIVYSHDDEKREYLQLLEFLTQKGLFKKGVEDLELEELQGISGLRALRIAMKL